MTGLIPSQSNLPATIEDLARFILVGREKLQSIRAEIRAIDKLQLAKDVREQKREEAQMLSEAVLDAEMKVGDLFKQLPKASGGDRKSDSFKNDSGVVFEKTDTKRQTIEALGFSAKQAERFETLAEHPDIVEQVKAEARENDDLPTRSRVLELVKEKQKRVMGGMDYPEYYKHIDKCKAQYDKYLDSVHRLLSLKIDTDLIDGLLFITKSGAITLDTHLDDIKRGLEKLHDLRARILNEQRKMRNEKAAKVDPQG